MTKIDVIMDNLDSLQKAMFDLSKDVSKLRKRVDYLEKLCTGGIDGNLV